MAFRVLTYIALAIVAACAVSLIGEALLIVLNLVLMAIGA